MLAVLLCLTFVRYGLKIVVSTTLRTCTYWMGRLAQLVMPSVRVACIPCGACGSAQQEPPPNAANATPLPIHEAMWGNVPLNIGRAATTPRRLRGLDSPQVNRKISD